MSDDLRMEATGVDGLEVARPRGCVAEVARPEVVWPEVACALEPCVCMISSIQPTPGGIHVPSWPTLTTERPSRGLAATPRLTIPHPTWSATDGPCQAGVRGRDACRLHRARGISSWSTELPDLIIDAGCKTPHVNRQRDTDADVRRDHR